MSQLSSDSFAADANDYSSAMIAKTLDHALLHPTMTTAEILEGCELAKRLSLASVCVKPYAIGEAKAALVGTEVRVGTVIGFPSGSHATAAKAAEAKIACQQGAMELDMVINVAKVLEKDWDFVTGDISSVLQVARSHNALLKVIFETDYVQDMDSIKKLCVICNQLNVDFVKTSTGFGFVKGEHGMHYVGATSEAIKLMRSTCKETIEVKASGGIRNRQDAIKFLKLGCTRLGTSASEAILAGAANDAKGY